MGKFKKIVTAVTPGGTTSEEIGQTLATEIPASLRPAVEESLERDIKKFDVEFNPEIITAQPPGEVDIAPGLKKQLLEAQPKRKKRRSKRSQKGGGTTDLTSAARRKARLTGGRGDADTLGGVSAASQFLG